jgi:hypothetical protein
LDTPGDLESDFPEFGLAAFAMKLACSGCILSASLQIETAEMLDLQAPGIFAMPGV